MLRDDLPVRAGDNTFVLEHQARGARQGSGRFEMNGQAEPEPMPMTPTLILGWVGEGLDIGMDSKQHVSPLYEAKGPLRYTGQVTQVRITPGAHPADSYANRREIESQRD
jgi:hypothetical protein